MKRQRGVTLVELTVTLILIGIVIFVGISFSAQMSDIVKRQEAQLQEAAWKTVLDNIQKGHLNQLANGVITSPANVSLTLTPAAVAACEAATNRPAVRSLLQNFAGDADAQGLDSNPWGGRWCLRVGTRATVTLSGLPVVVRPLAVFSDGVNGDIETNISNTIGLSCPSDAGDDRHICSSGVVAAAAALESTQEKMEIIAEKLKAYSRAQAILTPQGGFVDYFLRAAVTTTPIGCAGSLQTNPAYDINPDGPFGSTANIIGAGINGETIANIIGDDMNFPKFEETLGITAADAIDGFGGDIHLDNSSCAARHPYHPTNNTPPFSIRIVSVLPGGGHLTRIVFSDF